MANCRTCGQFAGAESWKKLCTACWKKEQTAKREAEVIELEELRVEVARLRDLLCDKPPPKQQPFSTTLTQEQLRWMIQQCHPDKHSGSEFAAAVTRWLIAQRR